MTCSKNTLTVELIKKPYFVWYEEDWVHDNELHQHKKGQLVYVESGFQYLTVEEKIYLLPQNHAAWIPSNAMHKTNSHSEKIKLMVLFFDVDFNQEDSFYNEVTIFSVPLVLKEMIKYAEKWSKNIEQNDNETAFLNSMYKELPHFVAQSLKLHISLPKDMRLYKAIEYLNNNYFADFKMDHLSEIAGLSLRTLERIFKKETNLTLSKYQQMLRIIKSLELLSSKELTISEIAFKVGYKSLQAYTNSFYSIMQYRPSDFLKEN